MTSTTQVKSKLQGAKNRLFAGFHGHEARIIFGTSGVYAARMLGVYMATPVLSPYAFGCESFDFDVDLDIDLLDFAGFQAAFSTFCSGSAS